MERRRSTRDRSRGPKAKPPPEQLVRGSKKKKPAAKKEITTNVKVNSPLDAPGDGGGQHVDATGDDVLDEPLDAPGNEDDDDKQVGATGDDTMERRRSTRDRSRGPKAKPPPEQLVPGSKENEPAAKKEITTNVKDNSPLDAPGDDSGQHVDATGDDVLDEPLDVPGNEDDDDKQLGMSSTVYSRSLSRSKGKTTSCEEGDHNECER